MPAMRRPGNSIESLMTEKRAALCTVLGFDFGLQRTGVALGQVDTKTATPIATLNSRHGKPDWTAISKLVSEWHPDALVVGVPLNPDGSPHEFNSLIEPFCDELYRRYGLPVYRADESLSSVEAKERLIGLRRGGRRRRIAKEEIDKMAAAVVLETWMSGEIDV
jgi:putative Holliday junction resolvase